MHLGESQNIEVEFEFIKKNLEAVEENEKTKNIKKEMMLCYIMINDYKRVKS